MFDNYRSNIVLTFLKPDGTGDFKKVRVTLGNVRTDINASEITQVATAFGSLIKHSLTDTELVQYSYVS
ncbi:hypothetical protein AEA09_18950 [Lysinibacillus contaminans]|uniref:DUF1659 domain-containing protein n=1 Tax=Lysinibacillus contaminans TaxID=1293441 RepID=A0ABR5JWC8_9BACI|nr:hypothetical protein [Lysinibacillus contaminans]KOS66294.1 hypothetical protein AEA09_18950 [Lysinibacillus contaminans]